VRRVVERRGVAFEQKVAHPVVEVAPDGQIAGRSGGGGEAEDEGQDGHQEAAEDAPLACFAFPEKCRIRNIM
jgi:hypothetical protein